MMSTKALTSMKDTATQNIHLGNPISSNCTPRAMFTPDFEKKQTELISLVDFNSLCSLFCLLFFMKSTNSCQ